MNGDRVRFAHPGPADPAEVRALSEACQQVVDSNSYILGPEVSAFEGSWAEFLGAAGAVGVANGLDAIEIGLRALGVGPGDEVIVPAMSAMATALGVHRAGAMPVFGDIDEETALLDLGLLDGLLTPRTRAVVPVHLYGRALDMPRLQEWASERGVVVVEDVAQAHGASIAGRRVGTWGDAGAFSFYPTKNLGALGDGGAVVSMKPTVVESAKALRNYGQLSQYQHQFLGLNSRLDEMQAAILSVRLPLLEVNTRARQEVASSYFAHLSNPHVRLLSQPAERDSYVAHLFVIRTNDRNGFLRHMSEADIECLIHYPVALPDQPAAQSWVTPGTYTPVARAHAATCVSLPCRPGLTGSDIERVIVAVNEYRP